MTKPDLTRVAHVDDDRSIREVARLALETFGGFQVLSCESGLEAVRSLPAFAPQLILLDVMMPELDGPGTVAQLAQQMDLTQVPVVFMSAKGQGELSIKPGIRYYQLAKPFDPMTLADHVRTIYTRHGEAANE